MTTEEIDAGVCTDCGKSLFRGEWTETENEMKKAKDRVEPKFDPDNEDSIQVAGEYDRLTGSSITVGCGEEMTLDEAIEGIAQIAMSSLVEVVRLKGEQSNEGLFVIALAGKIGSCYRGMKEYEALTERRDRWDDRE